MSHDVMKTISTPVSTRVVARKLTTPQLDGVPRDWLANDPFLSMFFNALSLLFPDGERYFMDAVRALREHVTEPQLQEDVRGFLAQEALHSREHAGFNSWLKRFGIDTDSMALAIAEQIEQRKARRTPLENLAVTSGLEHFTAIMAEAWLRDDELRAAADPRVRDMWTWHAIEEIEHKAVAFDVYRAAGGDYLTRIRFMAFISVAFTLSIARVQRSLLIKTGEQRNVRSMVRGLARLWGPGGTFTRVLPLYFRYYAPNFHPNDHDQSALRARFERELRRAGAFRDLTMVADEHTTDA